MSFEKYEMLEPLYSSFVPEGVLGMASGAGFSPGTELTSTIDTASKTHLNALSIGNHLNEHFSSELKHRQSS